MMKIVLATRNRHKKLEIQHILEGLDIELLTLDDFPHVPPVIEDKPTLEENAIKKANTVSEYTGLTALADDSGLEVEALGGAPGVYSARYAGEGCNYLDNNNKLLKELKDVAPEQRGASFRCVIAISVPNHKVYTVEGKIRGYIAEHMAGENGFGYDPLFFIPDLQKTFAQLSAAEKNQISHRAKALHKAREVINLLFRLRQSSDSE